MRGEISKGVNSDSFVSFFVHVSNCTSSVTMYLWLMESVMASRRAVLFPCTKPFIVTASSPSLLNLLPSSFDR